MTIRTTRSRRALAAAAVLTLTSLTAGAETPDWTFEVAEVSRENEDYHLIRLRPLPPGRKFPRSCAPLVVHSTFDLSEWSPEGRIALSFESHERALRTLRQAQATGTIVRFGVIGRGFAAIKESPRCEVASRALAYVVLDDGSTVVYSLFGEP
jgi:hypothetical protein